MQKKFANSRWRGEPWAFLPDRLWRKLTEFERLRYLLLLVKTTCDADRGRDEGANPMDAHE